MDHMNTKRKSYTSEYTLKVVLESMQDFEQEVMRLTDGSGVDVVLDNVGGDNLPKSYRVLRYGGRLVSYGSSGALVSKSTLQDPDLEMIESGSIRFADLQQDGRAVMGSGFDNNEALLRSWLKEIVALYLRERSSRTSTGSSPSLRLPRRITISKTAGT